MRRLLLPGVAALALVTGCGGGTGGPAGPGPLLLVSDRGGAVRIYELAPPDRAARLILSPRADDTSYADDQPARLPDGRIVFVSDRDGAPRIYLGRPDGRVAAPLTAEPGDAAPPVELDPAPLGREAVIFSRAVPGAPAGSPGDLYVAPLDGSPARRLTRNPADDRAPAASPDGRSVAFISDRSGRAHLYLIPDLGAADPEATAIDLSERTLQAAATIVAGRAFDDDGPTFLADDTIAFSRTPEGEPSQIFVIGIGRNGGGLRQLTDARTLPYGAAEPVALDAETILLTAGPTPPPEGGTGAGRYAVYTIAAGGFNLTPVSRRDAPYSDYTRRLRGRRRK